MDDDGPARGGAASEVADVVPLFLRLGLTDFGGPVGHVRSCSTKSSSDRR
jgi:hypothetical protein